VCGIAAPSGAQSAENLAFEVASIKQSVFPGDSRYFAGFATGAGCTPAVMTISGTRVRLRWAGLCNLIAQAYDLRDYAISGDQKWIRSPPRRPTMTPTGRPTMTLKPEFQMIQHL